MSREQFDFLSGGIDKITAHRVMLTEDTDDCFMKLWNGKKSMRFPSYCDFDGMFEFKSTYRGLIDQTYLGEQAEKCAVMIDKWKRKNKAEITQYKRLHEKYAGKL